MAEENPTPEAQPQPGQNIQLTLDDRDVKATYANFYRIHLSGEELVLDVGYSMPHPNQNPQQQGGTPQVLIKVSDRIIMNYGAAKRLAGSLSQVIKRHEQQFGEIPIQQGPRR